MFGFSFGELLVICVVALIAVGPKKLPGMLQTLGQWLRKLRNITTEVRNQTGIDDLLRSEGLHGGLNELRGLLRGGHATPFEPPQPQPLVTHTFHEDPYANMDIDASREYPFEGADSYGALPDDLLNNDPLPPEAPATVDTAAAPEPAESV
ncbi:MAG: twin-arginine translocase TatA/TatE family subunit [Polyangiaceae bacterium]